MDVDFFYKAFLLLIAGFFSGLGSSAPIGPINLWIAEKVWAKREDGLGWFLGGVIGIDILFAAFAFWGYISLIQDLHLENLMHLVGGLCLIFLGGLSFVKQKKEKKDLLFSNDMTIHSSILNRSASQFSFFMLGITMCGSNPAFLMFWVFIINILADYQLFHVPTENASVWGSHGALMIAFLGGIILGDLIWFRTLIRWTRKSISFISLKWMAYLRYGLAGSFVVLGCVALIKFLVR